MSNRDILKNGLKNLGISVDDKMLNDFNKALLRFCFSSN